MSKDIFNWIRLLLSNLTLDVPRDGASTVIPWVPHGTKTEVSTDHSVTLMCAKHHCTGFGSIPKAVQLHEHGSGLEQCNPACQQGKCVQIWRCTKLLLLSDKTLIPLHYEKAPLGVLWYICSTFTGYIINFIFLTWDNFTQFQCQPWWENFTLNILNKGWDKYLLVCLPLRLPTCSALQHEEQIKNRGLKINLD